jgi:hypothetical protein
MLLTFVALGMNEMDARRDMVRDFCGAWVEWGTNTKVAQLRLSSLLLGLLYLTCEDALSVSPLGAIERV